MEPQLVVTGEHVERVLNAAKAIGNPGALFGRFAGLGQAEQDAGVPTWAWIILAFGAGTLVGIQLAPTIDDFLRPNRGWE